MLPVTDKSCSAVRNVLPSGDVSEIAVRVEIETKLEGSYYIIILNDRSTDLFGESISNDATFEDIGKVTANGIGLITVQVSQSNQIILCSNVDSSSSSMTSGSGSGSGRSGLVVSKCMNILLAYLTNENLLREVLVLDGYTSYNLNKGSSGSGMLMHMQSSGAKSTSASTVLRTISNPFPVGHLVEGAAASIMTYCEPRNVPATAIFTLREASLSSDASLAFDAVRALLTEKCGAPFPTTLLATAASSKKKVQIDSFLLDTGNLYL